jgi:hypothetical protein
MRIVIVAAAALLTACASQQAPKQEAPPAATNQVPVTEKNVHSAIHSGKKIVDEKGNTLYCKVETKTGSRLQKTTTCLTEAQWDALAAESARAVERASSAPPPPQGR